MPLCNGSSGRKVGSSAIEDSAIGDNVDRSGNVGCLHVTPLSTMETPPSDTMADVAESRLSEDVSRQDEPSAILPAGIFDGGSDCTLLRFLYGLLESCEDALLLREDCDDL